MESQDGRTLLVGLRPPYRIRPDFYSLKSSNFLIELSDLREIPILLEITNDLRPLHLRSNLQLLRHGLPRESLLIDLINDTLHIR